MFCETYKDCYEIFGVDYAGWGSLDLNLTAGIRDFRADIADAVRMRSILDEVRPDAIVNFAAESHVDRANDDDSQFWTSNVLGVRNLALQAARLGIRLVQVSTDEVYGDGASLTQPWTEVSPLAPRNSYAATKAAAEMLLGVYARSRKYELDVVITRGVNTIGPRQFPEKAVPKAISAFLRDRPFELFQTPAKRMWMYVGDHVAGVEAAMARCEPGEIVNLAPGTEAEALTEDVITTICKLVGRGQIEKVHDRDNYDLRYWVDASKAKALLGWEAKLDLATTLETTVAWYLQNQQWLFVAEKALQMRSGA